MSQVDSSETLVRFRGEWKPVRGRKTRQIKPGGPLHRNRSGSASIARQPASGNAGLPARQFQACFRGGNFTGICGAVVAAREPSNEAFRLRASRTRKNFSASMAVTSPVDPSPFVEIDQTGFNHFQAIPATGFSDQT
ncbi:hypothetical protein [Bradyrhizobium sp.]|uniref:hypothetical protein n=1 Tax=Bradyrhizobium sp. TaxID=376 RepID=UPI0025C2ECE4|nr:hypothetical protein [Bradyrhizobium sp.]